MLFTLACGEELECMWSFHPCGSPSLKEAPDSQLCCTELRSEQQRALCFFLRSAFRHLSPYSFSCAASKTKFLLWNFVCRVRESKMPYLLFDFEKFVTRIEVNLTWKFAPLVGAWLFADMVEVFFCICRFYPDSQIRFVHPQILF